MKSRTIPVSLAATAVLLFAVSSPVCAETYSLQTYAYVQSYGCNGVDTGYYATDTTKFVVDFEFTDVSSKSWLIGAGHNTHKQCHAIYLNGNKQLAWTTRGQHWVATWNASSYKIAGSSIKDKRLVQTIASAGNTKTEVTTNLKYYDGSVEDITWHLVGNADNLTSTGPSDITTYLFCGNGDLGAGGGEKATAKIYSFEADDDCTSGVPAVFFAPAQNEGAAGFVNIIDGTFHGECCKEGVTTALSYSDGIGRASDYKWENGVLFAKFYAYSEDSVKGRVKLGSDDSGVGETSVWIARGASVTLSAIPCDGYVFTGWKGDTRAIVSGTASDASVSVTSDRAAQLLATFARTTTTARRAFDVGDYAQSGEDALLLQLDGIRNAEGGAHETSPAAWCDLANGTTVVANNGTPAFSGDAWVADAKTSFSLSSEAVKEAFANKSFTLEMFISHPPISDGYAYWIYSGNPDNRQLTAELRWPNSHNPLLEGVQWREPNSWRNANAVPAGSITAWNTRQHIAIVCDENGATTYCNGKWLHHTDGGSMDPTMSTITIGADLYGTNPLRDGAEISAIRMTARALSKDEIAYNAAIDAKRFLAGEAAAANEEANVIVESSATIDALDALNADLCGRYVAESGDVFKAPPVVFINGVGYKLEGYTLETWDEANAAWGEPVEYNGGTAYTATGDGKVRLTWQWRRVLRSDAGPISAYAQSSSDMLLHLDGILNAGSGSAHETAPTAWIDLVGGTAVAANGAPVFSEDAWVADGVSFFQTASDAVKNALAAKNFTLELIISHPGGQKTDDYGNYVYIGSDETNKRQLIVDLRQPNSENPLIQGVQYRESGWKSRSQLATSSVCKWKTRQYVSVVCDATGATTYCDGTQIHHTDGGSLEPSLSDITIGATQTGTSQLNPNAEICAVRMTKRALTSEELAHNQAVDHVRFTPDVIVVNGEVGETGVKGVSSLPSGRYDIEADSWAFTAEDIKVDGHIYNPRLTVETLINGEWANKRRFWTDSYTVDKSAIGESRIRLTWTWEVSKGFRVIVR